MKNVTRLTNDGDNGEAYFSWDGKKLIFQSSRGGYACDKIWTMNIDGSDKRMVSPDHGANTCSFFFPDGQDRLCLDEPSSRRLSSQGPRPRKGARYVWPLYPYDIFTANADGSDLRRRSPTIRSTMPNPSSRPTASRSCSGPSARGTSTSIS